MWDCFEQWFPNDCSVHQDRLNNLLKQRSLGSIPRISDSVGGLGWWPRICISNFPGDADALGLGRHFRNQWS